MSLNTFQLEPVKGLLVNATGVIAKTAIVNDGATAFGAGQFVKRVGERNGVVVVEACTAVDDEVFGVVQFENKHATNPEAYKAGSIINVITAFGEMMHIAGGTIAVGAELSIDATGTKLVTATTNQVVAVAKSAGTADGSIRVEFAVMGK